MNGLIGRLLDDGCIKVWLNDGELRLAADVGLQRALNAIERRRKSGNNLFEDNQWTYHIEGACGECAAAKWCNIFWNGSLGNIYARDVGPFQVRANLTRRTDNTILRPDDRDKANQICIGTLIYLPDVYLIGWCVIRDGMRDEYWCEPNPGRWCWKVPRSALQPMSTLPKYGAPI